VERAQAGVARGARLSQGEPFPDHLDDIDRGFDPLYKFHRVCGPLYRPPVCTYPRDDPVVAPTGGMLVRLDVRKLTWELHFARVEVCFLLQNDSFYFQ
jgi:hypothetical protein